MSEEQIPFFFTVFKDRPLATTFTFSKDVLKQLFRISYYDLDQASEKCLGSLPTRCLLV